MDMLQREPVHPGEVLKEEFLVPYGLSQSALARALHTSFRAVNELVNAKRGVSTEMALKLAKYFGTSPQLWLNLQNRYDLYNVAKKRKKAIDAVKAGDFEVA